MSYGDSMNTKLSAHLADRHLTTEEVDELVYAPDIKSQADFDALAKAVSRVSDSQLSGADHDTVEDHAAYARLRAFVAAGYQPVTPATGPLLTPPSPPGPLSRCAKRGAILAGVGYAGGIAIGASEAGIPGAAIGGAIGFWGGGALGCVVGLFE